MEFSRQEYWSGLPLPSLGDLPQPGIEPESPALQADSLPLSHQRSPTVCIENPKYHQESLSSNNEVSKVVGYNINIQTSVVFLYTNKRLPEREM